MQAVSNKHLNVGKECILSSPKQLEQESVKVCRRNEHVDQKDREMKGKNFWQALEKSPSSIHHHKKEFNAISMKLISA